jgi:hypothetical protein
MPMCTFDEARSGDSYNKSMTDSKRIQVTFELASQSQAAELNAAWQEILAGKRTRLNTAAEDLNEIMERARTALERITHAIERNPGAGQSRRLVRFLAGVYNGRDFPFDLTDLRALDTELANACIDYLNYDRLAKAEVHTHLPGGGRQMQTILRNAGVRPTPHFSSDAAHQSRLFALAERIDKQVDELVREAIEDLLSTHEAKTFGNLVASQSSYGDPPLIHAKAIADSVVKPLCGATDGPWSPRGFDFLRLTCRECQSIVLEHPDDLA